MRTIYCILGFVFMLFLSCAKEDLRSFGTTIEVPNEISSIQGAIDVAENHDTILLHPGEYNEWNIIIDKSIFITSLYSSEKDSDIINQTIINGNRKSRIFSISNLSDTVKMNGFTITGGKAYGNVDLTSDMDTYGGGILCINSNLNLTNMILTDNYAQRPNTRGTGGGLYFDGSSITFENVLITNNYAQKHGGGLYCNNSSFFCNKSKFENNRSYYYSPTEYFDNSYINIKNSLFKDIESQYAGGEIVFNTCSGLLENIQSNNSFTFNNSPIILTNCSIPGF